MSIKIGDSRLGSMETGVGMLRGLQMAAQRGCHVINMSYGEVNYDTFIVFSFFSKRFSNQGCSTM